MVTDADSYFPTKNGENVSRNNGVNNGISVPRVQEEERELGTDTETDINELQWRTWEATKRPEMRLG